MRKIARILLTGSFAAALACGSLALVTDARAGKPPKNCGCSTAYAPVWCQTSHGAARYDNLCLATCDGATGCVEIPLFPPS